MDSTELIYPVFEANQVLSSANLNDMFEYLDEQTRLTRADLIGIGTVCGLEAGLDGEAGIRLTRGCGVTSQGYLIVEPSDLPLTHVRTYTLPLEYGYQPFMKPGSDPAAQYKLWELFTDDDEPGAESLATSGLEMADMAVVLFLELRKDRMRNCSPNGCDDRGTEVATTVRRLLVDVDDLRAVIEAGRSAGTIPLAVEIEKRLDLPNLRMPRFDVPNTAPVAPERVLAGFQAAFRMNTIAATTASALSALYRAFKPLVGEDYANDPFVAFATRFGFLDSRPVTVGQVRFLQYYWDLFDDLIAGYDEMRRKGTDLLCACCPPQGLFPRHLVAGRLAPVAGDTFEYRTRFVPSPAVSDCANRSREVRMLFRRLVTMVERFTELPPDKVIKVTPSQWGAAPLSAKAIPYYYDQNGTPALFQVWNPTRTAQRQADLNLSYRADEYVPPAPPFVTDPLRFDLEPNDFLRIEGHLGKNVHLALESLLSLRTSRRLPFDVIALRTGTFDEKIEVDLSNERCRFQDLETLYETLKSELVCFLVKQVQYFYALPAPGRVVVGAEPIAPSIALLRKHAAGFRVQPNTLGHSIERVLNWAPGSAQPFVFTVEGVPHLPSHATALVVAMSNLSELVTDDIRDLDFTAFGRRYRAIVEIARQMDAARHEGVYDQPGLSDRLDDIVFRCRLEPFDALAAEYGRRIREVKQEQFLGNFLARHPGIQHKAGVPLGGTFILVYHERPAQAVRDAGTPRITERIVSAFDRTTAERLRATASSIGRKADLIEDADVRALLEILPGFLSPIVAPNAGTVDRIYLEAMAGIPDGTVIADFFLPYGCRSDCPPIQYQLPPTRLRVSTAKSCTNADGFAEVTLTVDGATGSLSVQVDNGSFEELAGRILLDVGDHSIVVRDAAGNESSPVQVTIPPQLVIHNVETTVEDAAGTYRVMFKIAGGTAPYVADPGQVADTTYTSPTLKVAETLTVTVKDAAGCTVEQTFESGVEPCEFPCDGVAVREGLWFWLPEARPKLPINGYRIDVRRFVVTDPKQTELDLTNDVAAELEWRPQPDGTLRPIPSTDFERIVQKWLLGVSKIVAGALAEAGWSQPDRLLTLEYEPAAKQEGTGTLFVDRMHCAGLSVELSVSFTQGRKEHQLEFAYDREGTVVVEPRSDSKFRIPFFDVSTSNRCRPGEPPVRQCEGTDVRLKIVGGGAPNDFTLKSSVSGGDPVAAFVWEVQDGIPSVAGGEAVTLRFEPIEPGRKTVRLTAITEKGCTVTAEQVMDIVAG